MSSHSLGISMIPIGHYFMGNRHVDPFVRKDSDFSFSVYDEVIQVRNINCFCKISYDCSKYTFRLNPKITKEIIRNSTLT